MGMAIHQSIQAETERLIDCLTSAEESALEAEYAEASTAPWETFDIWLWARMERKAAENVYAPLIDREVA